MSKKRLGLTKEESLLLLQVDEGIRHGLWPKIREIVYKRQGNTKNQDDVMKALRKSGRPMSAADVAKSCRWNDTAAHGRARLILANMASQKLIQRTERGLYSWNLEPVSNHK